MNDFINNKLKPWSIWFFKSFIWLGLLMLVIDIVSKNLVVANREFIRGSSSQGIVLIPNFLAISYVINTGAAFGLSAGDSEAGYMVNRIIYIVLAVVASGFLIFFYARNYKSKNPLSMYYKACIMLILAGAIGNLIDRIAYTPEYLGNKYNGVVDWINFFGIWAYNFNIADSCLVIGVIMTVVMLIIEEVKDSRKRNATIRKNIAAEKAAQQSKAAPEAVEEKPVENAPDAEEPKREAVEDTGK